MLWIATLKRQWVGHEAKGDNKTDTLKVNRNEKKCGPVTKTIVCHKFSENFVYYKLASDDGPLSLIFTCQILLQYLY